MEEIIVEEKAAESKKTCGIIMPIAPHADYPASHWLDVRLILEEAISETEFQPKLVSDDVAVGLIHDRIVTNIYNNEIVVCDVSSKNPNVMFELGMRLAFDKPTIIIKDENTGYSFDTGVIEHISYPSSLRFSQIVKFKDELKKRIKATYEKSNKDPNYSPFLKSFGKTIVPTTIKKTEVGEGKYIIDTLQKLREDVALISRQKNINDYDTDLSKFRTRKVKYTEAKSMNNPTRKEVEILVASIMNEKFQGNFSNIEFSFELIHSIQQEVLAKGFDVPLLDIELILYQFLKDRKENITSL